MFRIGQTLKLTEDYIKWAENTYGPESVLSKNYRAEVVTCNTIPTGYKLVYSVMGTWFTQLLNPDGLVETNPGVKVKMFEVAE